MPTPFRSALVALTGATVLVTASCSSSSEALPPSPASVTASAWVQPLPSQSFSSEPTRPNLSSNDEGSSGASVVTTGTGESDDAELVSTAPLPAGLTADEATQARLAIDAFRRYWALTDELAAAPTHDWSAEVAATSTGEAADFLQQSMGQLREGGWRGVGRTTVQITVTRVQPGAVDFSACVDVSKHDFLNQAGESYKGKKDRNVLSQFHGTGQVGQYDSGWKVNSYTSYPATPC